MNGRSGEGFVLLALVENLLSHLPPRGLLLEPAPSPCAGAEEEDDESRGPLSRFGPRRFLLSLPSALVEGLGEAVLAQRRTVRVKAPGRRAKEVKLRIIAMGMTMRLRAMRAVLPRCMVGTV